MTVFASKEEDLKALENSSQQLEIGKRVTVQPGVYHQYKVGDEDSTLRCIVEPGDQDFERLLKILNGLAEDGKLEEMGDSLVLGAVIVDLSDAHLIGPAGGAIAGIRQEKADEIADLKKELLEKYDTEEELKKSLANWFGGGGLGNLCVVCCCGIICT